MFRGGDDSRGLTKLANQITKISFFSLLLLVEVCQKAIKNVFSRAQQRSQCEV